MRIASVFLLLALAMPAAAEEPSPETQADVFYREGMAAVKAGQAQSARTAFGKALRLNPNHPHARYQMQELQQAGGYLAAKARERKLASVVIPKVDFIDSTMTEVVEGLDLLVRKNSPDQFIPNFIVQDPAKLFDKRLVTIQLRNIPSNAVLKYALEQARGTANYDAHAIVIKPVAEATAAK